MVVKITSWSVRSYAFTIFFNPYASVSGIDLIFARSCWIAVEDRCLQLHGACLQIPIWLECGSGLWPGIKTRKFAAQKTLAAHLLPPILSGFYYAPFSLKTKHSTQTQKLLPTFTQNFTVLQFPFLKQKLPLQFPQFLPLISFYSSQFLLTKTRLPSLTPLFLSFQFQHPRSLSLSPLFSLSCISTHNTLPSSLFFFFSVQHFLSSLSALFCSHSSVCS